MSKNLVNIIFCVLLVVIFWSWLLPFFPNVGPDLSYNYSPFTNSIPMPWIWANTLTGDGQGVYSAISLWTYPSQALYQLFQAAHIPFWFQMKYLAFLPMLVVAIVGVAKLSKRFGGNWQIASLMYVTNNYFLTLVDGGQLNLCIAYAILPLSLYTFLQSINQKLSKTIWFILSVLAIGSFDFRVVILEFFVIGIYLLINPHTIKDAIKPLILSLIILPLLNMFWLLPLLLTKSEIFSSGYGSIGQASQFSFASLRHALFFQSPNWYHNNFGQVEAVRWYFYLFPIVAFIPILINRTKAVILLTGLLLIGIILVKGTQAPFSFVYYFLYQFIPLFKIFRDPSKFYILIFLSSSLLVGIAAKIFPKKAVIPIMIGVASLAYPAVFGKLNGTFSKPLYLQEYASLEQELASNNEFSRTFWIPTKTSMGYASTNHPAVEAQWNIQKRPFLTSIVGTYELFNYLRSPATESLLDISSVNYIFYPKTDQRKHMLSADEIEHEDWFRDYFKQQSWVEYLPQYSNLGAFKTRVSSPRFYSVKTLLWVVGADDTYEQLAKLKIPLRNIGVIHINENFELLDQIKAFPGIDNRVVLNKTRPLDVTLANIQSQELISLAKNVRPDGNDPTGWWSRSGDNFLDFREFLRSSYDLKFNEFDLKQGYVIAEGNKTIKVTIPKGEVYIRVLESSQSGQLVIHSKDMRTTINTLSSDTALRWEPVGKLDQSGEISITSSGKINIINTLAILSKERVNELENNANELMSNYPSSNLLQLANSTFPNQQRVENKFINPTLHRLVNVEGPSLLVFTDNYNSQWQLRTKEGEVVSNSHMLYSLTNGFYIPKTQDYEVYFKPQANVNFGLVISVATMTMCILLILKKQ